MNRWSTLIDLEHETAKLGQLIEEQAPIQAIEDEFDLRSLQYFGYTRHELTGKVRDVVLLSLDDWYYEEIIALGERHGFDFSEKKGNQELSMWDDAGYVIEQWVYFAEMLIAKECGCFPSSSDEIAAVKLNRDARRFEEELHRQRQKPRTEHLEREQVFGKPLRELKPGSILVSQAKSKETKRPREIQVEVRSRDRRPLHGPSKRP